MKHSFLEKTYFLPILISVLIILAYANSFGGGFLYDDYINIVVNNSLRGEWSLKELLSPPGTSFRGRPLASLSFALNYAISGLSPWSYHLFNLAVHIFSALFLYGITLRLLRTEKLRQFTDAATPLALSISLVWGLHPLLTQAVSYISQRMESLAAMFFLATVYAAIAGWESLRRKNLLHGLALLSCLSGVFVKETIVAAPFMVLLCDYLFYAGSVRSALRRSPLLYAGLCIALAVLAAMVSTGMTASTNAMNTQLTPFAYLVAQSEIVFHYLYLVFWPGNLIFSYDWAPAVLENAWPFLCLYAGGAAATLFLVIRKHSTALPMAWIFFTLAPTSSFVPLTFLIFEYRMYLPLIGVVGLVLPLGHLAIKKIGQTLSIRLGKLELFCVGIMIFALGMATFVRNEAYHSDIFIWADTVVKQPTNITALNNLGASLLFAQRPEEALPILKRSLELAPEANSKVYSNLGAVYVLSGQYEKSISYLEKAISQNHKDYAAYNALGLAYEKLGKPDKALACYGRAHQLKPAYTQAKYNLNRLERKMQSDSSQRKK